MKTATQKVQNQTSESRREVQLLSKPTATKSERTEN